MDNNFQDLELVLRNDKVVLSASVLETKVYKNFHERISYEILESDGLGFDHAKIIINAFLLVLKRNF